MGIAIVGVAVLASERGAAGAEPTLAGDLLTFCGVAAFSTFTVLGKSERARYGPLTLTTIAYCSGALAFQPVVWGWYGASSLVGIPFASWAALLYMAILPAVAGYLIYFWALGHAPASKIATVQYIQPPLATGLSALLLGEAISPMLLIAGGVIMTGVVLAERAKA
jgi:drug/metabolite transporter (DMT)-like permease